MLLVWLCIDSVFFIVYLFISFVVNKACLLFYTFKPVFFAALRYRGSLGMITSITHTSSVTLSCVNKILAQCAYMTTGTVYFWQKKLLSVMQNFGIWGLMRQGVKLCRRKYFGIADPDLPIHYATSTGLRWWLRVVYSWAPSMLSVFGQKNHQSRFGDV